MGIQELKAKAYELAGVSNTAQLKAKYRAIGNLNLRLKSSWQQAIDFLKTSPEAEQTATKSIINLKAEVYKIAQASTTQQLKRKYKALNSLNFSLKASWEKAFKILQRDQTDFQAWLENPAEEYKELFAEIESVSKALSEKNHNAQHLGEEAKEMAENLENLSQEAQAEVRELKQISEAADRIAQQAELN